MTQGGTYQPKRISPIGMATVVLLHGVAFTAVLMAGGEAVTRIIHSPIQVQFIPEPKTPPEKASPLQPKPKTAQARVDTPTPQVPIPSPGPLVIGPPIPTPPPLPPGPTIIRNVDPTPVPLLPPPPKFEPARAHANLASYVSDADYPDAALRSEEQGTTRFRLVVGPDGKVSDCIVTGSSGSSALDAATCRLMKSRARFTAARDSSGNATTDSVASAIRWVLPAS